MNFNNNIPEWKNTGTEPSAELKQSGFTAGMKPPAGIFNWFWSKVQKAITEIQNNLSKVDNTKDSEKSVKYASEAGKSKKVKSGLSIRFNGGETEDSNLWTFDGSAAKSVNITPQNIGAAKASETIKIVNATTTDGTAYTATASDISELYNGLEITIIPNAENISLTPTLNLNGLGAKGIRLALSFNYAATNALKTRFMQAGRPVKLKYDANCNLGTYGIGAWIMTDRIRVSADDLYGAVPISSGGTGASNVKGAMENLGAASISYGSYVGTGTWGTNNPNTLTFDFVPKIVFVCHASESYESAMFMQGASEARVTSASSIVNVTWNDKTVSWYRHYSDDVSTLDYSKYQLNANGATYYYVALG